MNVEPSKKTVRRVVTGFDASGRSIIAEDTNVTTTATRPDGSMVMDLWRADHLPALFSDQDGLTGQVLPPPPNGLVVRVCSFAPNGQVDAEAYDQALADVYGASDSQASQSSIAGMHRTDTVDVVTVISGELFAVLETTETRLLPGDSIVQRGTSHAWHNRTDEPAVVVATMMTAAAQD